MARQRETVRVYNRSKHSCLGDRVELAERGFQRALGLLGRRSLAAGGGLVIVPSQAVHTVGMSFPLDVVFLDKSHTVIGLREDLRPFRFTRVFWKATAVIELPVGTIRDTRTELGDQLQIEF